MKVIQNIAFIWFKFEHTVCILVDSSDTRSQAEQILSLLNSNL